MTRKNQDDMISVDAETGIYWHGKHVLQTEAEINAFIGRQTLKLRAKNSMTPPMNPLTLKEVRASGYCFRGHALQ